MRACETAGPASSGLSFHVPKPSLGIFAPEAKVKLDEAAALRRAAEECMLGVVERAGGDAGRRSGRKEGDDGGREDEDALS